ncbi:DMT family transporter [Spongiactinospora sp. TRM90649]|uniref:DMT family transporter n=1 Tax=Spongiactinospora sp. TRM90649 TaxID=3031114 RepID=UPI0023F9F416|nr:DMT family transporter [Spongiactinospora sp. TRM90649]MDF5758108.1 DMT family transporter [Spongiactinospora sp. TRM90649]
MAVVASRPLLGAALLLFVSAAWGSAFPLMKDLIIRIPVADLLTERYGIGVLVLLALRPACLRGLSRATWSRGVVLGLLFGVGQTAQAVALHSLPSSVSGFAVGCNVVMTPVLGLLVLRMRISRRVWVAVALSAGAMAVFTLLRGVEGQDVSFLALSATLGAAALYAAHTLVLGRLTTDRPADGYAITVIQLATIAVMTGALSLPGGLTLPATGTDWAVLAHLAVVSCALGFLARTYGQAHVRAVPAAVLLSSQPLWVALLSVLVYGEPLTVSVVVGGAMVALAMLLVVLPGVVPKRRPAAGRPAPPRVTGEPRENLLRIRWRASEVLRALQEEGARDEWSADRGTGAVPYRAAPSRPPHSPGTRTGGPPRTGVMPADMGDLGGVGPPGERHGESIVDQMVQNAIEVVRLRATPEQIERCAPLLAVVCGAERERREEPDDLLATLETLDVELRELDRMMPADPDAK